MGESELRACGWRRLGPLVGYSGGIDDADQLRGSEGLGEKCR